MNYLVNKYKSKVTPGERTVVELIDYLKNKMDVVEMPTSILPESYLQHMIFNVINCLRNEKLNISIGENANRNPFIAALKVSKTRVGKQGGVRVAAAEENRKLTEQSAAVAKESKLTTDDLNFVAYKIIKNPKSNSYYQYDYAHLFDFQEDNFIFVVFETKTGVIHSNSGKLLLELHIKQGVSQYDYDNETVLFIDYLSSLEHYSNGEY